MNTETLAQVPDIAMPMEKRIPDELADGNWVTWGYELRDGKPTKVPYQINGNKADTTDPHTWIDFDKAVEHAAGSFGFRGIGRVFADKDPYCGLDFDDCMNPAGGLKAWARSWLEGLRKAGAYLEFSLSGNGIKAIVKATLPGGGRSRNVVEDGEKVGKIEITAEKDTYLPGDIVNLSVKVTGEEELDIEEGRVALVCANRYLYQYETTDSDNTESYRTKEAMDEVVAGDERILEEKTILAGSTSGHELAFEVPHTAAPSASGEITNVEWKVRVTLVVRGAPDVIKGLPLTILSTSDSSPPPGFQRPAA